MGYRAFVPAPLPPESPLIYGGELQTLRSAADRDIGRLDALVTLLPNPDPVLADLEDGSEEWRCALALDEHPLVRRWVRNLDSDPVNGFWLPTSSGRFYPDFVCELTDGRVFVAEYKGEHLRNVPKEIEKGQVGVVWAERSAGRAVFAMLYKLERGMNLSQQIDAALG